MPTQQPAAGTVAALLADPATRVSTLDALEARTGTHPEPVALAAIVGLSELMVLGVSEVGAELFQRIGLLRARLAVEAADPAEVYGAAWKDGQLEAVWDSSASALGQVFAKAPEELGAEDALFYACVWAMDPPAMVRGWTRAHTAGFGGSLAFFGKTMPIDPMGQ